MDPSRLLPVRLHVGSQHETAGSPVTRPTDRSGQLDLGLETNLRLNQPLVVVVVASIGGGGVTG